MCVTREAEFAEANSRHTYHLLDLVRHYALVQVLYY
jgi:hypothetical protein